MQTFQVGWLLLTFFGEKGVFGRNLILIRNGGWQLSKVSSHNCLQLLPELDKNQSQDQLSEAGLQPRPFKARTYAHAHALTNAPTSARTHVHTYARKHAHTHARASKHGEELTGSSLFAPKLTRLPLEALCVTPVTWAFMPIYIDSEHWCQYI